MSLTEIRKLEGTLRDSTRLVGMINKLHDRLSKSSFDQSVFDAQTEKDCQRLAELYEEAIKAAEEEDRSASKALKVVQQEFGMGASGPSRKSSVPKETNFYANASYPSAHGGRFQSAPKSRPLPSSEKPKKIFTPGTQVASKIVAFGMEPSWILGSIMDYVPATKKYRVKDEDPETPTAVEYLVPWKNVVSLSDETKLVESGGKVLAIYPDSTMFYHATVVKAPVDQHDDYTLFFDGDSSQVRMVNCHYVFSARD